MGQLPEFETYIHEGIARYGLNFGGSRLSNVRFDVFEQAEAFLATLGKAEAALTVSSGTIAGQLVAKYAENIGTLHYAPESHPAVRSIIGKTYTSREAWIEALVHSSHQVGPPLIAFSDAIDSLRVRLFDFSWTSNLGTARKVILVVDDSHVWGLTGVDGGGTYSLVNLPEKVELIVVSSLGKAYGIPAGVILGQQQTIQELWQSPFFGGASPSILAFLYAMIQSEHLYQRQRKRLFEQIRIFQQAVSSLELFDHHPDYPVFYAAAPTIADYLEAHKVLISSFPYPTPSSPLVNRIVINALHTREDIDQLATLVRQFSLQNT